MYYLCQVWWMSFLHTTLSATYSTSPGASSWNALAATLSTFAAIAAAGATTNSATAPALAVGFFLPDEQPPVLDEQPRS